MPTTKPAKKPRELNLISYGSNLNVKVDSKMTNIWINGTPVSSGNVKNLITWIQSYQKWDSNLPKKAKV